MTTGTRTRVALLLLAAVLFIGLLTVAVARRSGPPQPGDEAPEFSAPVLEGDGTVALEDFEGRPVFVNFWASWCVPCVEEAPHLQRAHDLYGDDVAFVGIDVKDSRSDAVAFARRHGLDYTHLRDEGRIYGDYGLTGQPESFFIDDDGVIVEHVAGPFFDEDDLFTLLDVLVARDA
jgi:cytochrome c biogenesis protein CcmG/thiol:disulfide interchange protein DsbE